MCWVWVVQEGFTEKVIFGQSSEGGTRISHVNTWRKRVPGRGHSKGKGPEVGTWLFEEQQEGSERGIGNNVWLTRTLAFALGKVGAREGLRTHDTI